jgi:hypothetical protein
MSGPPAPPTAVRCPYRHPAARPRARAATERSVRLHRWAGSTATARVPMKRAHRPPWTPTEPAARRRTAWRSPVRQATAPALPSPPRVRCAARSVRPKGPLVQNRAAPAPRLPAPAAATGCLVQRHPAPPDFALPLAAASLREAREGRRPDSPQWPPPGWRSSYNAGARSSKAFRSWRPWPDCAGLRDTARSGCRTAAPETFLRPDCSAPARKTQIPRTRWR